jgi:hypothetical protein
MKRWANGDEKTPSTRPAKAGGKPQKTRDLAHSLPSNVRTSVPTTSHPRRKDLRTPYFAEVFTKNVSNFDMVQNCSDHLYTFAAPMAYKSTYLHL